LQRLVSLKASCL